MYQTPSGNPEPSQRSLRGIVARMVDGRNRECEVVQLVGRPWSSTSEAKDASSFSGSSSRISRKQQPFSSTSSALPARQEQAWVRGSGSSCGLLTKEREP